MGKPLTKAQLEALLEISKYPPDHLYWWRPKAMEALAKLGFVETWLPPSVLERPRMKRRPWRITDLGRTALDQGGRIE